MQISEAEAERLLSHQDNYSNRLRVSESATVTPSGDTPPVPPSPVVYEPLHKGTRNGGREVPPLIRELIGVTAHFDTIKNTAKAFNVSTSTVAQAKKGNVGVDRHDPELAARIDANVEKKDKSVKDIALERLATMFSNVITDENLAGVTNPIKAVSVAKDLAIITEKLTPRVAGVNAAVFIQIPRVKDESEYESVDVKAAPTARRID